MYTLYIEKFGQMDVWTTRDADKAMAEYETAYIMGFRVILEYSNR